MRCVEGFRVVRYIILYSVNQIQIVYAAGFSAAYTVDDPPRSCRAERLDSKVFTLLHLCLIVIFDKANCFPAAMYLISSDRMAAQMVDRRN